MKTQRSITGKLMLGAAFFLCPCHLPIYLVLLGGTAAGALLSENAYTTGGVLALTFLAALVLGLRMLGKNISKAGSASERDPSEAGGHTLPARLNPVVAPWMRENRVALERGTSRSGRRPDFLGGFHLLPHPAEEALKAVDSTKEGT